jgi:hypothetical protein
LNTTRFLAAAVPHRRDGRAFLLLARDCSIDPDILEAVVDAATAATR